jgi:DNA polymerase III epsilon subunit-like protein
LEKEGCQMKDSLLRFKRNQKYMVFDFETCNLNLCSKENKPWQLGFILCRGNKVEKKYNYLIRWDDLNISADAAKITGFNRAKYEAQAVDPLEVLNFMEQYLYNPEYIKLGHNLLGFDIYIHSIFRKCLNKSPDFSYLDNLIDTLCLAKAIHEDIRPPEGKTLPWQFKLNSLILKGKKSSINALCKYYDITVDEKKLHDAVYDVEMNFKIFQKQIHDIEI